MNRLVLRVKQFIKLIISLMVSFIVKNDSKIDAKTLLIVRIDAIGDYILFRNFIKELKCSDKYKNYEITLVANEAYKDLAQELDAIYIKNFIWINRDKFSKDLVYRYKKLKEITKNGYEILINPTYSRDFIDSDAIANLVHADEKIAIDGDRSNSSKKQKKLGDSFYTKLIDTDKVTMFEFQRNKEFFESLLGSKLDISKPYINLEKKELDYLPTKKYVVIFIGGGAKFRKWDAKKYADIAKYLKDRYSYEVVLCGASCDVFEAKKFHNYFQSGYIDLVSKTSLVELLYVIDKADIVVSNETSAPHIAIALQQTKVFVVSNGNHFKRFTPYPKEITKNYHPIYHPKLDNSYTSSLDIDDITVDMVKKQIDKVLDEKH